METLREEVKVTATTELKPAVRSAATRPDEDSVVVRSEPNFHSAVDSSQTLHFLNGALPVAVTVTVPYPLAPLSLAPAGLRVTQQHSGPQRRFVRLEEPTIADLLISETGSNTHVELLARDHVTAAALWDDIRARVNDQLSESDTTRCQLWSTASYGSAGRDHKIKSSRWAEVRRNYPRSTTAELDALMALQSPDEDEGGKLVLWHGPPGTGKTSAVRTLVTEWAPWCDAHIISDPEAFFTSPDYLLEVVGEAPRPDFREPLRGLDELAPRRWKVIICEDADEYLRSDARERSGPALGRLLNLTDGLLGEGARTLVVLTTNDSLGRIHPAVQRPGRCRASIEFPALSAAEAAAWLPDGVRPPASSATLAELFAMTRGKDAPEAESGSGMYL